MIKNHYGLGNSQNAEILTDIHFKAKCDYQKLFAEAASISLFKHPVLRWRKFSEAYNLRTSHKRCCQWAHEKDD